MRNGPVLNSFYLPFSLLTPDVRASTHVTPRRPPGSGVWIWTWPWSSTSIDCVVTWPSHLPDSTHTRSTWTPVMLLILAWLLCWVSTGFDVEMATWATDATTARFTSQKSVCLLRFLQIFLCVSFIRCTCGESTSPFRFAAVSKQLTGEFLSASCRAQTNLHISEQHCITPKRSQRWAGQGYIDKYTFVIVEFVPYCVRVLPLSVVFINHIYLYTTLFKLFYYFYFPLFSHLSFCPPRSDLLWH